jgi:acyl-CoA synthetase (NDP forming)
MKTPAEIIQTVKAEGRKALFEHEAKELARAAGISVPRFEVVSADGEQSLRAGAEKLGFPLALKAVSPQVLHKT